MSRETLQIIVFGSIMLAFVGLFCVMLAVSYKNDREFEAELEKTRLAKQRTKLAV